MTRGDAVLRGLPRAAVSIIAAIVFLLVLPSPWNVVGFGASLVVAIGEIWFWHRKVRGQRRVVDADALIGKEAVVLTSSAPYGQELVDGEIVAATGDGGGQPRDQVRIV